MKGDIVIIYKEIQGVMALEQIVSGALKLIGEENIQNLAIDWQNNGCEIQRIRTDRSDPSNIDTEYPHYPVALRGDILNLFKQLLPFRNPEIIMLSENSPHSFRS